MEVNTVRYQHASNRLGVWRPEDDDHSGPHREYEITNHLGNVVAVISDRPIEVDNTGDGHADYLDAEVLQQQDYYLFGMVMPERTYTAQTGYRYGFNGKEADNEIKGEGNQQDYGMRIYDPRLGRFLSVDPLTKQYPFYSPYHFAGNTPIQAIDLDGGEPKGLPAGHPYVPSHPETGVKHIPSQYDRLSLPGSLVGQDGAYISGYAMQDIDKKCYVVYESAHGQRQWYREYDKDGWKGNVNNFEWRDPPKAGNELYWLTVAPLVAGPALVGAGEAGLLSLGSASLKQRAFAFAGDAISQRITNGSWSEVNWMSSLSDAAFANPVTSGTVGYYLNFTLNEGFSAAPLKTGNDFLKFGFNAGFSSLGNYTGELTGKSLSGELIFGKVTSNFGKAVGGAMGDLFGNATGNAAVKEVDDKKNQE